MDERNFNEAKNTSKKVLLISSSGGHWVQLSRLVPSLVSCNLYFASTDKSYQSTVPDGHFFYVPDASRTDTVFKILAQAITVLLTIIRVNPQVVITTGAAPGFFAVFFAKKMGKKTIWIDSIANVWEISMSGSRAIKHSDLMVTQWPHLDSELGAKYFGSVI
ncbi:UDP-N-acetylglucosamine--LPS N-acetylglucosamine transferase [Microbulbifer sp. ALW1]|uniref:UDP-N-acetylglucosamine--LPS N-acetylglucosamine transferase n=1 Tax=Microbulbifer sp. (strain ALW1) TaxID=1516059 RepID=UPI001358546E|nr:UDP-N-acetylglucosamine--LPS N-acetylglucosamine transferase [Microbulbifer sp. ALW1]